MMFFYNVPSWLGWLFVFIPTAIMLASIPFWKMQNLHNVALKGIAYLSIYGFAALILYSSVKSSSYDPQSPGWIGGIFIAIVIVMANIWQLKFYERKLNNKRCTHCHGLNLQTVDKEIKEYISTHTTGYINRRTGKRYVKEDTNTKTHITYTNYCPDCNNVFVWTEEKEEDLRHDTRPKDLR